MTGADKSVSQQLLSGLLERDNFAVELGIELISAEPGSVDLRLKVGARHMNFWHGRMAA